MSVRISIILCGTDTGVCAAHGFECIVQVLLLKVVHVVSTQQGEPVPPHQAVPQLLQLHRRGVVALAAEEIDEFAVHVQFRVLPVKLLEHGLEGIDGDGRGVPATGEHVEHLLRIDHDELPLSLLLLDGEAALPQRVLESSQTCLDGNDHGCVRGAHDGSEEVDEDFEQEFLGVVELDDMFEFVGVMAVGRVRAVNEGCTAESGCYRLHRREKAIVGLAVVSGVARRIRHDGGVGRVQLRSRGPVTYTLCAYIWP